MRTRRGFTLVELLVVISIIVVLAAIMFPVAMGMTGRAKVTQCQANLRELATGVNMYYQDIGKNRFYPRQDGAKFVAALWRAKVVTEPKLFICSATDDDNGDGAKLDGNENDEVPHGAISYAGRRNAPNSPSGLLSAVERRKIPQSRVAIMADRVWEEKDGATTNHGDRIVVAYLDTHTDILQVESDLGGKKALRMGEGGHEKLSDLQTD